jgi:hypothetical protein
MSSPRPRVSNLTPEELELLALEHVENLFMEFRATGRDVRRQCNPIKLAKDHPWIAAGLAAAAGAVLARYLRPRPAAPSQQKTAPASRGVLDSLLSVAVGAAAGAMPELLAGWTNRTKPG